MRWGIGKLRCYIVRGALSDYIDDTLDEDSKAAMERHLQLCEACCAELETLRATVLLLHNVPMVDVPRPFTLREADVASRRTRLFEPEGWGWLRPATAFVAIGFVVLLSVDFVMVDGMGSVNELQYERTAFNTQVEVDAAEDDRGGADLAEELPLAMLSDDAEKENDGDVGVEEVAGLMWGTPWAPDSNDTGVTDEGTEEFSALPTAEDMKIKPSQEGVFPGMANDTGFMAFGAQDPINKGNITEEVIPAEGNLTVDGNATADKIFGETHIMADADSAAGVTSAGGGIWPILQIEIAIGIMLNLFIIALIITAWQRRRYAGFQWDD